MNRCSSCGEPILWVRTPANRRMPLNASSGRWLKPDAGPDSGVAGDTGAVIKGTFASEEIAAAYETWTDARVVVPGHGAYVRVFTSHFATCPCADRHRRPRKAA